MLIINGNKNNEIYNLTNKETHVLHASKCYSTCYCHRHSTSLLTGMSNGTTSSFLEAFLIINDNDDYVVHFIFLYLLKLLFIIWNDRFFLCKNVDQSLWQLLHHLDYSNVSS